MLRSGKVDAFIGEENLLAVYLRNAEEFPIDDQITVRTDEYAELIDNPRYSRRAEENKFSYIWDQIITSFSSGVLRGTSLPPKGIEFDINSAEMSLRYMALEPRLKRRLLGKMIIDALWTARGKPRFFRMVCSPESDQVRGTAFFILTMQYMDWMDEEGGPEVLRECRYELAKVYATAILEKFRGLERVVGITFDAPDENGKSPPREILCGEQMDWSARDVEDLHASCRELGVFQDAQTSPVVKEASFPHARMAASAKAPHAFGNRRQRRRDNAMRRKSSRPKSG